MLRFRSKAKDPLLCEAFGPPVLPREDKSLLLNRAISATVQRAPVPIKAKDPLLGQALAGRPVLPEGGRNSLSLRCWIAR